MIEIVPIKELNADITVPGSKYVANRVLLICALAEGVSVLKNVPENDDINNTIKALQKFGINIKKEDNTLIINGSGGKLKLPENEINVGDSGTLLRFITGFASLVKGKTKITGSKRIQQRPIKDLLDNLKVLGIESESLNECCPPVIVNGGYLKGGKTIIKGNISSQFISSLLLIAPYAEKDIEIIVESDLVSKNYVDLTISLMEESGIKVERKNYEKFIIKSNQKYKAKEYTIPCDWSSASYFLAAAAIVPGVARINGLDMGSKQGESKFYRVLEQMGCIIKKGNNWLEVKGTTNLKSIDIDMGSMPDTVQTLVAVAVFSEGTTKIRNISNLKFKESDRIKDTATELRKLGLEVETKEDGLTIIPSKITPAVIDPYNDHRMAMSFALIGLKIPGIEIKNPGCVNKSFPEFWEKLKEIGVEIKNV